MVLPLANCDTSTAVCCSGVYDVADVILAEAMAALGECGEPDCPGLAGYVTIGDGDGVTDGLAVALESVSPAHRAQSTKLSVNRAEYTVRLLESGWPIVQAVGSEIVMPAPEKQHVLSRHVMSHAEVVYRRLRHVVAHRDFGSTRTTWAEIGSLVPLPPKMGVVGFRMTIRVDIP